MGLAADKYEELLDEIDVLKAKNEREITRLRSELIRALVLLSEWAPDTFEHNYMTPEQRAEANKDDRKWYAQLAADNIKMVLKK